MKTINVLLLGIIVVLGLTLSSCQEDEIDASAQDDEVNVQFGQNSLVLAETSDFVSITFQMNKPATADGKLVLQVQGDDAVEVTAIPAIQNHTIELPVAKNSSALSFKLKPVNNDVHGGSKNISIEIVQVPTGLKIGANKKLDVSIVDDEGPVTANFVTASGAVFENEIDGVAVAILLSSAIAATDNIEISVQSANAQYGVDYTTEPAVENGKINVPVLAGITTASFRVLPINNSVLIGSKELVFKIVAKEGIEKGTVFTHNFTINDDELHAKPKGFETSGGGWGMTNTIEYDPKGRVHKIYWTTFTPGERSGTDTYYYDNNDRLLHIDKGHGKEIQYVWQDNKIVRANYLDDNVVEEYIDYDYDHHGNVSGSAVYHKQPTGEMKLTSIIVYLTFLDGNIYKKMVYIPSEDPEEPILNSTSTYDHYIANSVNPIPMVSILPTINSQKNLPGYYRYEAHGSDLEYTLSYEFREDGLPTKRHVTGPASETTSYWYY